MKRSIALACILALEINVVALAGGKGEQCGGDPPSPPSPPSQPSRPSVPTPTPSPAPPSPNASTRSNDAWCSGTFWWQPRERCRIEPRTGGGLAGEVIRGGTVQALY